jgi:hypothetical protein
MRRGTLVVLTAILIALAGCSSQQADTDSMQNTDSTVAQNPYGGFPVDPPAADEVVLTISGAENRDYTMGELVDAATQEITILEPFVKRVETFKGVPLSVLFNENGLTSSSQVTTIALNDYRYTDSVDAFTGSNGILAVSRDGAPIPMDEGGPIRIVFPEDSPYFTFLDAWNWSLRSIESASGS